MINPMLASDAVESKIKFPCIAQPKIDGVRSLNMDGTLTGRSLKQHANFYVTTFFSHTDLNGFDGEMAAERETHPKLCSLTSSALSRIEGQPYIIWWVFDYLHGEAVHLPYSQRLELMEKTVDILQGKNYHDRDSPVHHLRSIPWVLCNTLEELLKCDSKWLEEGFEGTIVRDPNGKHKQGRSTVKEGGLLRIKRFVDAEIVVTEIIEGERNDNEAQVNELGLQYRTSHQENKVANGMVGAMMGRIIQDILDLDGTVLFRTGEIIKVGAGRMTHGDRCHYFNQPKELIGQIAKFKTFPKGVKDKPRFPTFQSIRSRSDFL